MTRRFRLPALFCAFAVLLCAWISHPYADIGFCDDGPYIFMARTVALTGHIRYVGAQAAMLGAQLYIGAALIKLIGFSFTVVRMASLVTAMATAFLLQRTMVRCDVNERNATLGTLILVLSPLFLILSVTYMSDIYGLFGVVACLYCCVRALSALSSKRAVAWICAAVVLDAVFGTARQIAWLGILVMVPSTLWLLRSRRKVLFSGMILVCAGAIFVFGCMKWFAHQPYSLPAPSGGGRFPFLHVGAQFVHALFDIPFLLLPLFAIFLPDLYKSRRRILVTTALGLCYVLLAFHWRDRHIDLLLEPTQGFFVTSSGGFQGLVNSLPPVFLSFSTQVVLTFVSLGGLLGLLMSLLARRSNPHRSVSGHLLQWQQLAIIFVPFTLAYIVLLIPSATNAIYDRYSCELLVLLAICLLRYYQERVHPRLPAAFILLVVATAVYGLASTHNTFSFYSARVALASELHSSGVPETAIDNGWEENLDVELRHADHINDPGIKVPADAYIKPQPLPPGTCNLNRGNYTPHIRPIYGISFDPNACYGPAPFAPVHYSRWLAASPGTLYVVRYLPPESPQYRR